MKTAAYSQLTPGQVFYLASDFDFSGKTPLWNCVKDPKGYFSSRSGCDHSDLNADTKVFVNA